MLRVHPGVPSPMKILAPLLLAVLAPVSQLLAAPVVGDPASPTVLITGSNRGVGLALVREYAGHGWNVLATCRHPAEATELNALAKDNPRVRVEALDVADVGAIQTLAAKYAGVPIDVLLNNAAVLGDVPKQQYGNLDQATFTQVMLTNVFGPLKVSEVFTPNVAASGQKKIVAITSGLGSLTLMGRMSKFYDYQMSKAALNMGFRALRNDLKPRGVTVAILAPGVVKTDLLQESGYGGKSLTPEESAAGLFKLIEALTPDDKGIPVNVDGKELPW